MTMRKTSKASDDGVQHYVAQQILRNFCVEPVTKESPQIWVYDKKTDRTFRTNIKNVAAEHDFYNFTEDGYEYTVDPGLTRLERAFVKCLRKIIAGRSLAGLTPDDKELLLMFIAVQKVRGKDLRESLWDMQEGVAAAFRQRGDDLANVENFEILDEKGIKRDSIRMMTNLAQTFVPHLRDKQLVLFETHPPHLYYISDTPVVMQNTIHPRNSLKSGLGLAVDGIEIYLPVSRTLTLALLWSGYRSALMLAYQKHMAIKQRDPDEAAIQEIPGTSSVEALVYGLQTGNAVLSGLQNVLNLNSLQVAYSSRYVYCATNDFELVREMLKEHPNLREVQRVLVD
jgi:hypothetical protein